MNLKELREKLKALGLELKTLGTKNDRTADEETRLDAVMNEYNDLAPKLERLLAVEAASKRAGELGESRGRTAGAEAHAGNAEGEQTRGEQENGRRLSLGAQFAASDAVKEWLATGGKRSQKVATGSILARRPELGYAAGQGPMERHALVTTEDTPSYLVPPMVVPGIFRPTDYQLRMRDVIAGGRTTADTIYFLRELLYTSAATEVGQATATAGASGLKPEATLTFEQDSAPVVTIAHWIPITRQAIADAAQLQSYVEGRLIVGLERRLNSQIANGAGGATDMEGILSTTGIQLLDNTYFGANPVENAGTDNEVFDRLARAQTLIETVGDASASFIAFNPADHERLLTTTDGNRQYFGAGPFGGALGMSPVWGMTAVRDRAIPEGTALVGDGMMAQLWDREDANILIDTIDDQFIRNMLTILAELRAALTVYRPVAFAEVELYAS